MTPPADCPALVTPTADRWIGSVGLVLLAMSLAYRLSSPVLLEDPNDGQYAEVAREMFESGEWISPTLNGVLFLNKPPLLYWCIAAAYQVFGVSEAAARIPGAIATFITVLLLYRLGCLLRDRPHGYLCAAAYVAMPSVLIEARFVRPDTLLVAAIVASVTSFVQLRAATTPVDRNRALVLLQVALAGGVLAKGILALMLPGMVIVASLLVSARLDLLRVLLRTQSWLVFFALIAPWHVVAAWRHDGFAWDYIVQQHFLFFLDRKLPRDSIPIPLAEFWGAFSGRSFPWVILLPFATWHSIQRLRLRGSATPATEILVWCWGILAFFSAAVSRLEHYALPALPAVAVLVAEFFHAPAQSNRRAAVAHLSIVTLLVTLGAFVGPSLVAAVGELRSATDLPILLQQLLGVLAATGGVAIVVAFRQPRHAVLVFALGSLALMPLLHRGLVAIAPINSSAPLAEFLQRHGAANAEIILEAPTEYQHVAGLDFYLRRTVTLLGPEGFVFPDYLAPHRDALFIDRKELDRRWRDRKVYFITDPLAAPSRSLTSILPGRYHILATINGRDIVENER